MKKNSTMTVMICSLVAVFATVVFYLLTFDNTSTIPMRRFSMMILLIIEIAGTIKALNVSKNILGIVQITTGVLHLLATLVLSILFVNLFPLLIKEYILFNILMFIVVAVIDSLLLHFNRNSQILTNNYIVNASNIDMCEIKVRQLWVENKESSFGSELESIVEMLTYANRAMVASSDNELLIRIEELSELISGNESEKTAETIKQIRNILRLRIEVTKKTGSF